MATNDTVVGTVEEVLPDLKYRVIVGEREYICYLAGKMKLNKIRVLLGDKVEVVLDPYGGKASNRIVRRRDDLRGR